MNDLFLFILLLYFLIPRREGPGTASSSLIRGSSKSIGASRKLAYNMQYIKKELYSHIGQYIKVTVKASINNADGFSGFLLRIGGDYIEVLCFPYHHDGSLGCWIPYVATIPIGKITSVTHRP